MSFSRFVILSAGTKCRNRRISKFVKEIRSTTLGLRLASLRMTVLFLDCFVAYAPRNDEVVK